MSTTAQSRYCDDGCGRKDSAFSELPIDIHWRIFDFVEEIHWDPSQKETPLVPLSLTSHYLREMAAPCLFQTIGIYGDWSHVWDRLCQIYRYPAPSKYIEAFLFSVHLAEQQTQQPPKDLPALLASVLGSFCYLRQLVLVIASRSAHLFAVSLRKLCFQRVHTLVISPFTPWAIRICPSITHLSVLESGWLDGLQAPENNNDILDIIRTASFSAPSLKTLEIDGEWSGDLIHAILFSLPALEVLSIENGNDELSYHELASLLSRLPRLTALAIGDAYSQRLAWQWPRRQFNNPWVPEPEVREAAQWYKRVVEEEIAEVLVPQCTKLKELWIGCRSQAVIVDGSGDRNRDWIWERGEKRDRMFSVTDLQSRKPTDWNECMVGYGGLFGAM